MRLLNRLVTWARRDKGQTLVEYALIVGLVSVAAIVVMITMGGSIKDVFQLIADKLGTVSL